MLARRAAKGRRLRDLLAGSLPLPGQANAHHDYWAFPAMMEQPLPFVAEMRRHGFDAANLPRNQAVAAPPDRPELHPRVAADLLAKLVILPCYDGMPDSELARMATLVRKIVPQPSAVEARAAE